MLYLNPAKDTIIYEVERDKRRAYRVAFAHMRHTNNTQHIIRLPEIAGTMPVMPKIPHAVKVKLRARQNTRSINIIFPAKTTYIKPDTIEKCLKQAVYNVCKSNERRNKNSTANDSKVLSDMTAQAYKLMTGKNVILSRRPTKKPYTHIGKNGRKYTRMVPSYEIIKIDTDNGMIIDDCYQSAWINLLEQANACGYIVNDACMPAHIEYTEQDGYKYAYIVCDHCRFILYKVRTNQQLEKPANKYIYTAIQCCIASYTGTHTSKRAINNPIHNAPMPSINGVVRRIDYRLAYDRMSKRNDITSTDLLVFRLYMRGAKQIDIAKHVGRNQSSVCRSIKRTTAIMREYLV